MRKNKNFELIKEKLEKFPQFRERKTRGQFIAKLVARKLGFTPNEDEDYPLDLIQLAEFSDTYATFERIWRQILLQNATLRGSDYTEKKKLMEKKRISLGYEY